MIVKNIYNTSLEMPSYYNNDCELSKYDIETLENDGIEQIWYFYSYGSYEGNGQILMRKDNLYHLHDAGHCSCYGPVDKYKFHGDDIDNLYNNLSNEYQLEVKSLFDDAKIDMRKNKLNSI